MRRRVALALAILVLGVSFGTIHADNLKGRWYFGANISFLSTTDSIRSNAALDDDPRPDDFESQEGTVDEAFKYDLTAGFGLTGWLSLQLDASYFRSDVSSVRGLLRDTLPVGAQVGTGFRFSGFEDDEEVIPVVAGRLTEIPVSLSAIVRFRKDTRLNPYIGVGAGMIFTEVEPSGELADLNARLSRLRILGLRDENGVNLVPYKDLFPALTGRIPLRHPLTIEVEDAPEWHLVAGADYSFNSRISLVFDARYTFTGTDVVVDMNGEDQINYTIYSEGLFRRDGTVRLFNSAGEHPNTIDPNTITPSNPQGSPFDCEPNPPGPRDIDDDDHDGNPANDDDLCYDSVNLPPSKSGSRQPRGILLVQGGSINLTAFSVAIGLRVRF